MESKSSLLEQLKIDRGPQPQTTGGPSRGKIVALAAIAVIVLAAIAALVVWDTSRAGEIPVQTAVAEAISSGGAGSPAGASILDASGYVVAMRDATVSSYLEDRIVQVMVQEGETVKKGQIIAKLDDSTYLATLAQAQAQVGQQRASLAAAHIAASDAKPIYLRDQKQLAQGLISPDAFDSEKATYDAAQAAVKVAEKNLSAAQANVVYNQRLLDYTIIRAPFDGVVTAKNAQPGQIVSSYYSGGGGLAEIVDMNSLEVDVDVSENYISRVHPDQPASVTLDAYPDWHIPAHVIAIIPTADKSKATVQVRVGFKSKDPRILPQMGARVSFLADASTASASSASIRSGVIIPSSAVSTNGNTGTVYVIDGDRVTSRKVRLGANTAQGQEILSGLNPGATVAIGDFSKLHDGVRVRITQQATQ
ncbi:MAG: efflux RND transporter periplasmic adaptor subunit [Steroidobacteraceae bacterium]